jgi:uncharacterized membrane protein YuzA (DUF378 family)
MQLSTRLVLFYLSLCLILIACLNYTFTALGNNVIENLLGKNSMYTKALYYVFTFAILYIFYDIISNKELFDAYLVATSN